MPSRAAQEKLLLRVHEEIGLNPSETAMVEVRAALSSALTCLQMAEFSSRAMGLALKPGKRSYGQVDARN